MGNFKKEIRNVLSDDFSHCALWELRNNRGLQQCDLAERMHIAQSSICVAERKRCTFRQLLEIANTLGYKVDVIIREGDTTYGQ